MCHIGTVKQHFQRLLCGAVSLCCCLHSWSTVFPCIFLVPRTHCNRAIAWLPLQHPSCVLLAWSSLHLQSPMTGSLRLMPAHTPAACVSGLFTYQSLASCCHVQYMFPMNQASRCSSSSVYLMIDHQVPFAPMRAQHDASIAQQQLIRPCLH